MPEPVFALIFFEEKKYAKLVLAITHTLRIEVLQSQPHSLPLSSSSSLSSALTLAPSSSTSSQPSTATPAASQPPPRWLRAVRQLSALFPDDGEDNENNKVKVNSNDEPLLAAATGDAGGCGLPAPSRREAAELRTLAQRATTPLFLDSLWARLHAPVLSRSQQPQQQPQQQQPLPAPGGSLTFMALLQQVLVAAADQWRPSAAAPDLASPAAAGAAGDAAGAPNADANAHARECDRNYRTTLFPEIMPS